MNEHRRCPIFHGRSSGCNKMRSAGVYLIQAEIGTIRNAAIPAGDILITLRIGRSSASISIKNPEAVAELHLGSLIQLNVDSSALDTQRCSITFNSSDKRIIGIVLISLPKDKSLLQNTFRLTQNEDRRAEVGVKITIAPFEVGKNTPPQAEGKEGRSEGVPSTENILPRIYASTNSLKQETLSNNPQNGNMKSKISEEFSCSSEDRKTPKSFKVREEDRVVQTTESELKRYREEKEAYYQLYQIEKSKNEVAAKFIANLVRKIGEKHPSLMSVVSESDSRRGEEKKKGQGQGQVDGAVVAQLEQANRSLHRQVEEYKRLVEQMKGDLSSHPVPRGEIPLNSKASNTFLLPGLFDFPSKSTLQQRSNIKNGSAIPTPSSLPSLPVEEKKGSLNEIDFKKWLDLSIGQREEIQALLGTLTQKPAEGQDKNQKLLKKLKASLDKSFTALLGRKDLTRQALMAHKKEVNRCFEEVLI